MKLVESSQPCAANPPSPSAIPPVHPPGCAAAGCLSWDLVMVFIYSSALMSSFGEERTVCFRNIYLGNVSPEK